MVNDLKRTQLSKLSPKTAQEVVRAGWSKFCFASIASECAGCRKRIFGLEPALRRSSHERQVWAVLDS